VELALGQDWRLLAIKTDTGGLALRIEAAKTGGAMTTFVETYSAKCVLGAIRVDGAYVWYGSTDPALAMLSFSLDNGTSSDVSTQNLPSGTNDAHKFIVAQLPVDVHAVDVTGRASDGSTVPSMDCHLPSGG
jgi:hypothetical protein